MRYHLLDADLLTSFMNATTPYYLATSDTRSATLLVFNAVSPFDLLLARAVSIDFVQQTSRFQGYREIQSRDLFLP